MIRQQGEAAIYRLRDEARAMAPQLGLEEEVDAFSALVLTIM